MPNNSDVVGGFNDGAASLQALKAEVYAWRHNRLLYPGWLLAPYQTRDKIWNNTKHWLGVAIAANSAWTEPQLLVLWREMTWRLGICLQIVPDEALDTIRNIVDKWGELLHDSAEEDVGGFFPEAEGWPKEFKLDNQELKECWLACRLTLLQGYRIRPDIAAFEEIENQLYVTPQLSGDQHCFVLYQSCLRAMAELDSERAQLLLARWPNQPEDDYWLVRRAAVLLELGDLPAARRVADDALQRIRGRQQTRHTDYWKLSREGWCLKLLANIEWLERYASIDAPLDDPQNSPDAEEWTNPAWKSRLDHRLESARCSPDTELRALQGQINKRLPPPRPSGRIANPPGFDTGDVSESIQWSSDIPSDRLAPAINLLLASDATGHSLAGEYGMYATSWIRDEFSGLWAAFALRFGGVGVTRDPEPSGEAKPDSIRRTTLEQLPKQHVERLFSATLGELVRVVERAQVGKDGRMLAFGGGVWISAARLSDIVTRLSMCLNADARENLIELLLQAARIPLFRRHPAEQATIRHLAERSIRYLEKEQLKNWFFKILLNVPLDSNESAQGRGLPSISDNLRLVKVDVVDRAESEEIDAGVRQLIEGVGSSDIMTRTDAALRLLLLVDLKVLSEEEQDVFSQSLWRDVDDCNLPVINDETVSKHVHLSWPHQSDGQSVSGLVEWIISGRVEDRFGVSGGNGEDDESRRSLSWPDREVYLSKLLNLAIFLGDDAETFERVFNERSRRHVLESILQWWERERELFGRAAKPSMMHLGDVFARVDQSLRVIFECALGKEGLEEGVQDRLICFLNDIEGFGRLSPYSHPIRACINREQQMSAWNGIRNDLWSADQEVGYKALIAASQWQRGVKRLGLVSMPTDVLTIVVSAMAGLEGVVGYHAFWVLRLLVEKNCIQVVDGALCEIVAAVESAAGKLAYGSDLVGVSVSDQEKRAHVRRSLAELIVCLQRRGIAVGPAGVGWIGDAKEDSFVDIRRIAREWRN